MAADTAASVQVLRTFAGSEIATLSACSVGELRSLLEEVTGVPAEYQILLPKDDVVPLQDDTMSILSLDTEDILGSPQRVVLFSSLAPKQPDLELWKLCQGCSCGFREGPRNTQCTDLAEKQCRCQRQAGAGPRLVQVQYLLGHVQEDGPFLQTLFERIVLAGGSDDYTTAAKQLAQDPRINVNATGCSFAVSANPTLLEVALDYEHDKMIHMLIESGRLEVDYEGMVRRLQVYESDYGNEMATSFPKTGGPEDTDRIFDVVHSREKIVCEFMKKKGWPKQPFCKKYMQCYRKALAFVYADDELPASTAATALGQEFELDEALGHAAPRMHLSHKERRRVPVGVKHGASRDAKKERKEATELEKKLAQRAEEKARCARRGRQRAAKRGVN